MLDIYFDGGAVPNPGQCHAALMVEGKPMEAKLGYGTNNFAEWTALLWGMETALHHGAEDVTLMGDSKLIVMQSTGMWRIKQRDFLSIKAEFDLLRPKFRSCAVRYVPREKNLAGIHIEMQQKLGRK